MGVGDCRLAKSSLKFLCVFNQCHKRVGERHMIKAFNIQAMLTMPYGPHQIVYLIMIAERDHWFCQEVGKDYSVKLRSDDSLHRRYFGQQVLHIHTWRPTNPIN